MKRSMIFLATFLLVSVLHSETILAIQSNGSQTQLLSIESDTGLGTLIGDTGVGPIDGLAVGLDGTIFAVNNANGDLVTLNRNTGAVDTIIGSTNESNIEGLAIRPNDGVLFGVNTRDDTLVTINTNDGSTTTIGGLDIGVVAGISFSFDGSQLFVIDFSGNLLEIDPTDATTIRNVNNNVQGPLGITAISTNEFFVADFSNVFSSLDIANGSRTFVGNVGFNQVEGLAFDFGASNAVPEPSTYAFFALFGLAVFARRRKIG